MKRGQKKYSNVLEGIAEEKDETMLEYEDKTFSNVLNDGNLASAGSLNPQASESPFKPMDNITFSQDDDTPSFHLGNESD